MRPSSTRLKQLSLNQLTVDKSPGQWFSDQAKRYVDRPLDRPQLDGAFQYLDSSGFINPRPTKNR